jgi:AcrR family transcriptional regulator
MPPKKHIDLQRVVQIGVALANEDGFEAVTLAGVAEQLGIRIPSLYNHVSGLPGLRSEIALWGIKQLAEGLRRAAVGKAGDDAVLSLAHAYRAFAHANPGIYATTLRAASPDEPERMALGQEIIEILFAVLTPYKLSEDDTLHAIRSLRSVLHGFVDLETAGGFGLALDRDESFRQLVAILINGLHAYQSEAAN